MSTIGAARVAILEAVADVVNRSSSVVAETPIDDWSLDERSLCFIDRLVHHLQPEGVLEFGSGRSTVVLAGAVASLSQPTVLASIESDPFHLHRTREMLSSSHLCTYAHVLAAHVVARRLNGRYVPTYYLDETAGQCALRPAWADLILVDGPPLPLGGREGALYQALHTARVGGVLVIDDSRRDSERTLLSRLLAQFKGSLEAMNLLGFRKGLATAIVVQPISIEERP